MNRRPDCVTERARRGDVVALEAMLGTMLVARQALLAADPHARGQHQTARVLIAQIDAMRAALAQYLWPDESVHEGEEDLDDLF